MGEEGFEVTAVADAASAMAQAQAPPDGLVIDIEDITIAPGQKDEMALPGGYGITYQSNSKDEVAPNLYAGLVEDDAAYNFAASAVGLKPGSTISLLVEQKLPFARRVASEFCILDKGRRVAAGPIEGLTDEVVRAHLSV